MNLCLLITLSVSLVAILRGLLVDKNTQVKSNFEDVLLLIKLQKIYLGVEEMEVKDFVVERKGIEPSTSALRTLRSPN